MEQHSVPIYDADWGADEEVLLLEAAEVHGLGSWEDIANHIGGFRTVDEVRDHYIDTYIHSSKFPLPERVDPNDTTLLTENPHEEFQARKKQRIEERREAAKTAPPAAPAQKPAVTEPKCDEVEGYMPARLEFETEFRNKAEEKIQHMYFEPGDGINPHTGEIDPETDLKLQVLDVYNCRLNARTDRKRVMFEHNLLEYGKNEQIHKERTEEERDLCNKTKPFAKMMNHKEFSEAATGFELEHQLRQAVTQLQDWRSVRISDLKSGKKYESEKRVRAKLPVPTGQPSAITALTAPELPGRLKSAQLPNGARRGLLANGTANSTLTSGKIKYNTLPIRGVRPLELTPENATYLQLFTKEEQELCSLLRMMPKAYIAIKNSLLGEAVNTGGSLTKEAFREICKVCNIIPSVGVCG
jgi:transcriptional adapter 2-alpha